MRNRLKVNEVIRFINLETERQFAHKHKMIIGKQFCCFNKEVDSFQEVSSFIKSCTYCQEREPFTCNFIYRRKSINCNAVLNNFKWRDITWIKMLIALLLEISFLVGVFKIG